MQGQRIAGSIVSVALLALALAARAQESGIAPKAPGTGTDRSSADKIPRGSGSDTPEGSDKSAEPDRPLEAPQPKFEKREKFEDDTPAAATTLPAPGATLDHALVGPRGTFYLRGSYGEASFLWPLGGDSPKFYRESMTYTSAEGDAILYRLTGRYHRVWFKVATKAEPDGHRIWVRNGDKDWTPFDTAVAAPRAF